MSASDLPEPTIDQARRLGEKGSPARESERLLFEAWMRGHCWAIGGAWNGKQYKASDEDGSRVNQQAMLTRMLWAAWRDRGTLADDQLRAYGDKRAREAVEALQHIPQSVIDKAWNDYWGDVAEARKTENSVLAAHIGHETWYSWDAWVYAVRHAAAMLAAAPTTGEKT